MTVQVFKMTYVGVDEPRTFAKEFSDFVEETESDTVEVWASDIQRMEDELAERKALTSDEYFEPTITEEQAEKFKNTIGTEVYDMMLENKIEVALIVQL